MDAELLASRYEMLEIEPRGEHQCLYHFRNEGYHLEAEIFIDAIEFEIYLCYDYEEQFPPHQQVRWQLLENDGRIKILSES